MNTKPLTLRRYTSLPALIYLLQSKSLTLLSPSSWDDGNDKHCLEQYKEKRGLSVLLAACFTDAPETYHHWRVFAGDSSGCCVVFNREKLLTRLRPLRGITFGEVDYRTLSRMRSTTPHIEHLPFIKRSGYIDESEFRVIYESSRRKITKKDIPISIEYIEQIAFNPWINRSLFSTAKRLLQSIDGCQNLANRIVQSTLTGNAEWKEIIEDAD
jgi:hypothetical protein